MAFYHDDLDEFFGDFNDIAVTSTLYQFNCIFDLGQEFVDTESGQIVNAEPTITAKTSDVVDLTRGETVDVLGSSWIILDKRDDRTGVSIIRVRKV